MRHCGEPISCMWYDDLNKELFFAVAEVIGSIDISARVSPWNTPSQVLPAQVRPPGRVAALRSLAIPNRDMLSHLLSHLSSAQDYIDDLAKCNANIAGILPVSGDVLVTASDGSVNRMQMVAKEDGELSKLWKRHVMARLVNCQIWLDHNLGKLAHLFAKKELNLSLELQVGTVHAAKHPAPRWAAAHRGTPRH